MTAATTLVLVAVAGTAIVGVGYYLLGTVPAIVFAVFVLGSAVAWRWTTYGKPADPSRIVVPYLAAVILFIVHVLEEYLTEFWEAMSLMTGEPMSQRNFLLVAAFAGPVLWLVGLVLFYLRTEIGNYLAWAFFVAMTISELAHFVFPFAAYGRFQYFPGMYTAALPLIPAWIGVYRLIQESRRPW
jgi:hypothetical protein